MSKALKIAFAAAAIVVMAVGVANAGLNAGGSAQLYWQNGTALGLAARDNSSLTPQFVVTAKGLTNLRGIDCQLLVNGAGGTLPVDWDFTATGCNAGNFSSFKGGRGGAYPNAITTATAITGLAVSQEGMIYQTGDCVTPHGVALLWLSAAGAAGQTRTAATEYGIWAIKFDLATNNGVCDPNGPQAVCINPNFRIPCTDVQRGAVLGVVDGNLAYDYLPFAAGKTFLTWGGGASQTYCAGVTPTVKTSWGSLKKVYR